VQYRFLRLCAGALPLLAWFASPIPAYADSAVGIDCGDGAPISGSVDATTLTELQGAVQAMVDNPSGMTCSLTLGALDPLGSANSPGSFVVGGGRYGLTPSDCVINFSVSAHVDQHGAAHGTQTATEPNTPNNQPCGGEGHVKADVTCVAVLGNMAEVRGDIMEQSGSLSSQFFFPPNAPVWFTVVQDNGRPNTGVPDRIEQGVDAAGTENNCATDLAGQGPPFFTVDNGNVTVHGG
jgi:hypothetical protein